MAVLRPHRPPVGGGGQGLEVDPKTLSKGCWSSRDTGSNYVRNYRITSGYELVIVARKLELPILFGANTRAGDFKQAVWTVIATNFNRDTSIASHFIAFFAEIEVWEFMEAELMRGVLRMRSN